MPALNHRTTPKCEPSSISFSQLDQLISEQYQRCFKAQVRCQYDQLLYLTDPDTGRVQAAVGFRQAAQQTLYLEHYLDSPAESLLSTLYQRPVSRSHLVEIGNFIGLNGKASFALMHHLLTHLQQQGYQHALLTCTRQLKRTFQSLPIQVLTPADPQRVSASEQWGSYYQQNPEVITAALSAYDQRFAKLSQHHPHHSHYLNRQGQQHAL